MVIFWRNPPNGGVECKEGMKKWRFSTNISLYLRNGYSQMGTCSETICKHRILFPSIQHLAWLPQGRPEGKQKYGKNSDFWLTHWLKHHITRKLLKIDRYMLRGVWQALNCLSIHATHCVIVAGASPGETKNVGCGTWKRRVFAIAVRITGKLLKIDGYMLRDNF